VIATFACTLAACRAAGADPQPAIMAAFIALSLSLRTARSRAHPLLHAAALTAIAPLAAGTGLLLHASPPLGAAMFTAIIGCSVWARDWGGFAQRLGTLAALPLLAILIVPPPAQGAPGGPWVDLALVTGGGLIALLWVSAFQRLSARTGEPIGGTPSPSASGAGAARKTAARPDSRLSVSQRLALQLTVALAAAFAVGLLAFAEHWGWTVLTAFIVSSGARGRGDAAYKSVLRLIGALGGTVAATLIGAVVAPRGITEAIAIFGVLFIGVLLREVNYTYWACCMTLVLACWPAERAEAASHNCSDFGSWRSSPAHCARWPRRGSSSRSAPKRSSGGGSPTPYRRSTNSSLRLPGRPIAPADSPNSKRG